MSLEVGSVFRLVIDENYFCELKSKEKLSFQAFVAFLLKESKHLDSHNAINSFVSSFRLCVSVIILFYNLLPWSF